MRQSAPQNPEVTMGYFMQSGCTCDKCLSFLLTVDEFFSRIRWVSCDYGEIF
jgi:hypothetical protein